MKNLPTLKLEIDLWSKGYTVVGIDEVGRGSFAGPLVVGAVVFSPTKNSKHIVQLQSYGINDSKKLSPNKRQLLTKIIQKECALLIIEHISHSIINGEGVGNAQKMGFENIAHKIIKKLPKSKIFFLTDAFKIAKIDKNLQLNIIRGDSTSLSIAAASIVAKVNRDNYMVKVSEQYPQYGFEKNKGYGTAFHRNAIRKFGLSPTHRIQFCKKYSNFPPMVASKQSFEE